MTQHIVSWSYSKLGDFEKCKLSAKIKHLDKIPEPPRPLPPGKTEHANDRGSRIHESAEQFVNGTGPFVKEMAEFEQEFLHLQHLYTRGVVSLEGEWAHDKDWNIAPWKTGWLRLKLDAMVHASETEAVVIDFKSGKKFGNEVKHAEQLQLYQLSAFLRFPKLEVVHAELWYLDARDITTSTYTREQGLRFKRSFDKRGTALTSETEFPANPNSFSCRWCPYGPDGTGHCAVGVRK
jgi:PD-(D/E)XK nuclease superfamily